MRFFQELCTTCENETCRVHSRAFSVAYINMNHVETT